MRLRPCSLSVALLVLIFCPAPMAAAGARRVWHVDNGRTAGDGSAKAPFATITAAIEASAAGDEITVAPGRGPYAGGISLKSGQQLSGVDGSASPVITAAEGAVVTAAGGVVIRHVEIIATASATGLRITGGDVRADHCRFRDSAGRALHITGASAVTVADCSFNSISGNAIDLTAAEKQTASLTVTSSRFERIAAAVSVSGTGASHVRVSLSGNVIAASNVSAISLFARDEATVTATIDRNQIANSVCGGGCDGIRLTASDAASMQAAVQDNTISGADESAIRAAASGIAVVTLAIERNSVRDAHGAGAGPAIVVQAGAAARDTARVCANISGNTAGKGWAAGQDIRVVRGASDAVLGIEGVNASGSAAAVEAAIVTRNPGMAAKAVARNGATGAVATPASCTMAD